MATKVTMPQMGYDMTEGSIQTWLKKEGDAVKKGETIAEIETDKATIELEAFAGGVLKKIIVQPGQVVPVNEVIAVIADPGEEVDWTALGVDPGAGSAVATAAPTAPKAEATPTATAPAPAQSQVAAAPAPATLSSGSPAARTALPRVATNLINLGAPVSAAGGPGGAAVESEMVGAKPAEHVPANPQPAHGLQAAPGEGEGAEALPTTIPHTAASFTTAPVRQTAQGQSNGATTATPRHEGERVKSSPLARKVAGEMGVDIAQVPGTGPGGRVIKNDVVGFTGAATTEPAPQAMPDVAEAVAAHPTAAAPQATPAATGTWASGPYEERPVSRMRQTIARRLTEAKQQIPHIYISNEIDMGEAMKLRQTINATIEKDGGAKVSVNDMVVKAAAKALKKFPALNASFMGATARFNQRINVSIAVALEDGLLTPVVFDVDQKSIGQVAAEARSLIEKARAGKLRPEEFEGGTFSVSNLGMFDVTDFVAVINTPNAAILAVGAVKPTPIVTGDADSYSEVSVAQIMKVTISVDHRIADGAVAAQFLQELKRILQSPMGLLI